MQSLSKVYSKEALLGFLDRCSRLTGPVVFVAEPKFDGLAVSATYENGRLIRVVTRGDGLEGDDVTTNAVRFANIPQTLVGEPHRDFPHRIELRGEVFMQWEEFRRLRDESDDAERPVFQSPRNLAVGTLKSIEGKEHEMRRLSAVFYGVGDCEPASAAPDSEVALLAQLHRWGLPTVESPQISKSVEAIWSEVMRLSKSRLQLPYPIDGVVVKVDSFAARKTLGEGEQAPVWAVAFKFASESAVTRVRRITIQVGRTGKLTPVAELEAVELAGAKIQRATLHNADYAAKIGVRVGDEVKVERTGDVIPAITAIYPERRQASSEAWAFPLVCPSCQKDVAPITGESEIRCHNRRCPAQVVQRLTHFASKQGLGISGLGEATIRSLVESGKVSDFADLYALRPEDLARVPGIGVRRAERLSKKIQDSRSGQLARLLSALSLKGVGPSAANRLARNFQSLPAIAQASADELMKRSELSADSAESVRDFLSEPAGSALIKVFNK
jgi:DNA ligase (NAD+)